jgi:hypothetical protein
MVSNNVLPYDQLRILKIIDVFYLLIKAGSAHEMQPVVNQLKPVFMRYIIHSHNYSLPWKLHHLLALPENP